MARRILLIIFCTVAFIFPWTSTVHAQAVPSTDVSVNLVPANPGPDQSVTVSVQSYSVDLTTATIQWIVDGQKTISGIGDDSYTFTTKGIGQSTNISVVISPLNGTPVTQNVTVTPMSVDLLWETTDSIVPPFYRGKAMPTSESYIKVVAIPDVVSTSGEIIAPENLSYDWEDQYTEDVTNSGYGKDSFNVAMDYLNPTSIVDVTVSTLDGGTAATNEISINPVQPEILFYSSDPLNGPNFDQALTTDNYSVKGSEISLVAEPYFFSPGDPTSPTLSYTWTLNGQPVTSSATTPNVLNLQRTDTSTGSAILGLSVNNINRLFQSATANLNFALE